MKLITFTVPCYNSAAYMDRCIKTLLPAGEDAEIILVDDGSKDETGAIADAWAEKYPTIIRVIHQENGGHGEGVNQGIRNASGLYFKVVDSDDWLDADALQKVMTKLREFAAMPQPVDLLLCNYVYEHTVDNTHHTVRYTGILPQDKVFTWQEIGHFPPSQNILMHSVIYRTQILRDCGLRLPKTPSMWITSLSICPCPAAAACIIWTWTCTGTLSAGKTRASTKRSWSSGWTSRCGSPS